MSDCCSSKPEATHSKKQHCPKCNNNCSSVSLATVLHHIKQPWQQLDSDDDSYFFCRTPDCNVVYFDTSASSITKDKLRSKVGIKETDESSLICYCFDVNRHEAQTNPHAKAFVIEQTKNGTCTCATYNPSGKCCLKDFPKE